MEKWTGNREFHKLHRGGGGQSTTHSPTMAATAAGKAAAVAAVGVAMVLVVGRDDGVREAAGGVGGGAWHGGCCHGGVGCRRRYMAMVDGGSYRSGYGESFWGSPKNFFGDGRGGGRRRLAGGR
nr:hypothetical protein [Tanacetum cinerariifolium]